MQAPRGFESLPLRQHGTPCSGFLVLDLRDGAQGWRAGMARRRGREFKCGREFNLRGGAVFLVRVLGRGREFRLVNFLLQFPRTCFKVIETCTNWRTKPCQMILLQNGIC